MAIPPRRTAVTAIIAATLIMAVANSSRAAHVPRADAGLPTASDSADVVATVERFHAALAAGDSGAALALLADDALILESGAVETRADYRAHHLPADINFARAVPSKRTVTRVTVSGDAAWVASTSDTRGEANGRPVNSAGAELVVLRRTANRWQIVAIHWSSRARRSTG